MLLSGRPGAPWEERVSLNSLLPWFSVSGPCSWALNVLPGCIAGKTFSPRGFPVGPELVTGTCHHSGWWGGDPGWVMPYPLHPPLLGVRRGGHSLVLSRDWVWDPTRPYPGSWKPGRHESMASRGPMRRVRWGLRETLPWRQCACCAQILWGHCFFRLSTSPDLHLFWKGMWLLARQGLPSSEHGVTSPLPSGSWALSGNHVNIERLSIAPSWFPTKWSKDHVSPIFHLAFLTGVLSVLRWSLDGKHAGEQGNSGACGVNGTFQNLGSEKSFSWVGNATEHF